MVAPPGGPGGGWLLRPGSFRYDAYAVVLTNLVAFLVGCGVVDLVEVVFDAAWDGDQEQLGGLVLGPEPVRAAVGEEHEAACRGVEGVAAAADGQSAAQHIEALIFPVMDVQRRAGPIVVSKTLSAPPVERCDAFRPGSPAMPAPGGMT